MMLELEIDMQECLDELTDGIVLVDEMRELPPMVFVPHEPVCHAVLMDCFGNPPYNETGLNGNDVSFGCSNCGYPWKKLNLGNSKLQCRVKACPNCGLKVVKQNEIEDQSS